MAEERPRIQFATTSDGVSIAYTVAGEGMPLVCVPGWVSHLELEWGGPTGEFNRRLAQSYRLILYDGRGTGLSDRNVDDLSLQARLKDLEAVVDHLGLERFALFAWSSGTPVAIVYASEHPGQLSHLVLYAAFCDASGRNEDASLGRALVDLIRAEWGVGIRTTMGFIHPDADRQEVEQALTYLRSASTGEVAGRILEDSFFHIDVCDRLSRISTPALVLHRRDDHAVDPEGGRRVASLLPDARFAVLDGDHHLPFHGDSESIVRAMHEFLTGEAAPPTPAAATPWAIDAVLREATATVTLLFTDIEGSTTLTERLGDAIAQDLLRAHNDIVRDALSAHGGSEVKHTGDGIMASFPSASRALDCAIAIQRALAQHNQQHTDAPIQVRIGLNAGEPVQEEGDLFGTAVQVARRICDRAEAGQILASNVVRELAAGKGFLFSDQGETALRGFEDPVRLYEVRWAEP